MDDAEPPKAKQLTEEEISRVSLGLYFKNSKIGI